MSILSHNQTSYKNDKLHNPVKQIMEFLATLYNHVFLKSTKEGRINFASSNIKTKFGYKDSEILKQNLQEFVQENDRKQLHEIYTGSTTQRFYKLTLRLRKKDGIYLPVLLLIRPIKDRNNNVNELFYVIKEMYHTEDENLLHSDKMVLIGQLAAGVAHEIRNPLTSLKGFIQLMKSDTKLNMDYLEIMENEIDRIDSISNELMAFAKPSPRDYKKHNLNAIFENCMTLLEQEAIQRKIKVVRKFSEEQVNVYCDEQKIKQVIFNLIKNAMEAMEEPGYLTIEIHKENEYGVLSIQDEGTGIPKDLLDKLGQPFFTTKASGNGLGLMMCYKIIEEHDGKLHVESEWGVGSTFSIYLPIEPVRQSIIETK